MSTIGYSTVTFIQGQLTGYADCTPLVLTLEEAKEEARIFNSSEWNREDEIHCVVEVRLLSSDTEAAA